MQSEESGGPQGPLNRAGDVLWSPSPSRREWEVTLIGEEVLIEAESYVDGCQRCAANITMTFDYVLDAVTGRDPVSTEYLMCRVGECPRCRGEITEKTLVVARSHGY